MFALDTAVVDDDAPVGEHTIDVQQQQANVRRLSAQRGWFGFHCETLKAGFDQIVQVNDADRILGLMFKHE
jgi:hypothetical protein